MKFLVLSLALVAAVSAQQVYKSQESPSRYARILEQKSVVEPNGGYEWNYNTEDGISAGERADFKTVGPNGELGKEATGGYQYTAPDGQVIAVRYTADVNGFRAEGSHIPVAPPIPEAILRSLAYNAANPQKEDAYYKGEEEKPYYTKPIAPTPRPYVQYPTPAPFYPSVQPTYQTPFQAGLPQQRVAFSPQPYYPQAGRR